MDNLSQNRDGEMNHPPDDEFLEFVDGEMTGPEMSAWQSHLDACWFCRVRVGKIQETIADIIEFENTVTESQFSDTGHGWKNLGPRFSEVDKEIEHPSFASRLSAIWNDLHPFHHTLPRLAVSSLALIVIAALIYQFVLVAPVSASQLLDRAVNEQQQALGTTTRPVVHRRIKLTRKDQSSYLDIWNEMGTARNKRLLSPGDDVEVAAEYSAVMSRNGLDADRPLSPDDYRIWRDSLRSKSEMVERMVADGNIETLRLTTTVIAERQDGDITHASLTVRASDYHAISQSIEFQSGGEIHNIHIVEVGFDVVARDELSADFFDTPGATLPAAHTPASNIPPGSPLNNGNTSQMPNAPNGLAASGSPSIEPKATLETEVEIFKALDSVNALSGDQIAVTRTSDGRLRVAGIVDSPSRKTEILKSLSSVRDLPGVVVDVKTAQEAALAANKQNRGRTGEIQLDSVTGETSRQLAVEPELRAFLLRRGVKDVSMDAEVRSFAGSVIDRAETLSRNAFSLKSLAERFSSADLDRLDPAKRQEWKSLLRSKASAITSDVRSLQSQIGPVVGVGSLSGSDAMDVSDIAAAAQRLYGLAAACERQVNQSFAVSSASSAAVKSPQFWRNLAQMAVIAEEIRKF